MKTSETSTRPRFIGGFFDSFSNRFGHAHRRASSALPVGLRHDPYGVLLVLLITLWEVIAFSIEIALVLLLKLLLLGIPLRVI